MKSKNMRCSEYSAEEERTVSKLRLENLKERDHWADLDKDGGYYWFRPNATSRKVSSYSDEVIGGFNLPNPASRTMALWFTQPLTEMSTRNSPAVKHGRRVRLTT
jgi:hypothetical protein